jgi:hypothetical protein
MWGIEERAGNLAADVRTRLPAAQSRQTTVNLAAGMPTVRRCERHRPEWM